MNARQAVSIVEAREERVRRQELERQSERKREALRRTQEAAAEARRIAAEEERRRQDTELLGQYEDVTSSSDEPEHLPDGNVPGAVVPAAGSDSTPLLDAGEIAPAADGGNAPTAEIPPTSAD